MSKTLTEMIEEERRLIILRALEESPGYRSSDSLLAVILLNFGVSTTRDQVRTSLTWLKENGLVEIDEIATIMLAALTQRGAEVAQGVTSVPGVKRPSPK